MREPISTSSEWTFELIQKYDLEISRLAHDFKLDTYPNQIEIISAEQMMDAYSATGMPLGYNHWSFGKSFMSTEKNYKRGNMGLAYEIVINSDPCIAYLMEENTMTMQALVIAHACYGHNSFFKNNYLFKLWTSADAIIDYLVFAKKYIGECEQCYGIDNVETLIDACHALMNYGVDRYRHPQPLSLHEEKIRQRNREQYHQSQINDLWRTIPKKNHKEALDNHGMFPSEPQENILYFLEKNSPTLESWQREIVRIVRKISQYFYPQRQTQVMNEGWATFWHYTLLNALYDEGKVTDEFMLEFLQNHTSVILQPSYDQNYFNGINPYSLGFSMMTDIRRMCEHPTQEDKEWFPDIAGKPWIPTLDFAMRNFKDESFIAQYLSPKVIRDLKLFAIRDDDLKDDLLVSAIHNEQGYQDIRSLLSMQYNLSFNEPNIQVHHADIHGDRSLHLHHIQHQRIPLGQDKHVMLQFLNNLWGFPVHLETVDMHGKVMESMSFPK